MKQCIGHAKGVFCLRRRWCQVCSVWKKTRRQRLHDPVTDTGVSLQLKLSCLRLVNSNQRPSSAEHPHCWTGDSVAAQTRPKVFCCANASGLIKRVVCVFSRTVCLHSWPQCHYTRRLRFRRMKCSSCALGLHVLVLSVFCQSPGAADRPLACLLEGVFLTWIGSPTTKELWMPL